MLIAGQPGTGKTAIAMGRMLPNDLVVETLLIYFFKGWRKHWEWIHHSRLWQAVRYFHWR